MSYRTKLLLAFTLTVAASVGVVSWLVMSTTQRAFEQLDEQRTRALVDQFRREYAGRAADLVRRVEAVAGEEATLQMAMELARPNGDATLYHGDATGIAKAQRLDFVELVNHEGLIISSAQWPAKFGYKNDWVVGPHAPADWGAEGAFLHREELADGAALSLTVVRPVTVSDKKLYIIGGKRLDKEFLATLSLPQGMRVLLYRNLDPQFTASLLADANGPFDQPDRVQPLIEEARKQPAERRVNIRWSLDPASEEAVYVMPLLGRSKELLAVLLVGSSRREVVSLLQFIQWTAVLVGLAGIGLGALVSWWAAGRVARPVRQLAEASQRIAAGDLSARVPESGRDEIGKLSASFNQMTQQLFEQRDRLLQAERVAAWRELARRLAHELKNPLFPLQITVENLQRARLRGQAEFDEVFRESTATLQGELEKLKSIVARFSDFAKMPQPELRPIDVNEVVRGAVKLFEAQFAMPGRPLITPELYLEPQSLTIHADAELLHKAIQNLILNAMDAMPAGGTLTLRTARLPGGARIEVGDTGVGLTREEADRLFTPYYTSKVHGTGLGLAIVQSVVSDHHGRISVESEHGRGATFRVDLPTHPSAPLAKPQAVARMAPPAMAEPQEAETAAAPLAGAVEPAALAADREAVTEVPVAGRMDEPALSVPPRFEAVSEPLPAGQQELAAPVATDLQCIVRQRLAEVRAGRDEHSGALPGPEMTPATEPQPIVAAASGSVAWPVESTHRPVVERVATLEELMALERPSPPVPAESVDGEAGSAGAQESSTEPPRGKTRDLFSWFK